jgi:hypothetical protein
MPLAIFGISSNAANVVVSGLILLLVAIWFALVLFTFNDSRRRVEDPFLVGCATFASFIFPFFGTIIYTIVRPGEYLEDARERELEVRDTEARLRHHEANSCRKCGTPTQPDFIKCPACRTRLKQPCPSCSKPVGLNWKLCPYCEETLIEPKRSSRRESSKPDERKGRGRRKDSGRKATAAAEKKPSGARAASSSKPDSDARPSRRRGTDSRESGRSADPVESDRPETADPALHSSRSSRRRVVGTDEDQAAKPINSGDAVPEGGDAVPRSQDTETR